MSDPRDEARDLNAAEQALGVLDAKALAAAEARAAGDPAYAAELEAWQARLAPLAEDVAPLTPSEHVWTRVEQVTGGNVASFIPKPAAPPKAPARTWRTWAVGATGLAAAGIGAVFLLTAPPAIAPAPQPHHMVAKVMTMDGKPDVVVAFDVNAKDLMLTPVGDMPPPGMAPRMWLMRKDGTVKLVGDVDMAHPERKHLDRATAGEMEHAMGVVISLESAATRPGVRPSGPLVAKGMFSSI
jgi:anti-sigma-K factor RskA